MNTKQVLTEYPDKIITLEKNIYQEKQTLERELTRIEQIKLNVINEVEKDAEIEEHKKSLSNATKRANEVQKRLGYNRNYLNQELRVTEQKEIIQDKEWQLKLLQYRFQSAKALARMGDV